MSILQHRLRLHRVLLLAKHKQLISTANAAALLHCHPCTIKRLLARLRLEGNVIEYDKQLKRYVLQTEE